eukprot:COSAG04_NODE_2977_length_3323_cov_1.714640_5_plen_330_part_00
MLRAPLLALRGSATLAPAVWSAALLLATLLPDDRHAVGPRAGRERVGWRRRRRPGEHLHAAVSPARRSVLSSSATVHVTLALWPSSSDASPRAQDRRPGHHAGRPRWRATWHPVHGRRREPDASAPEAAHGTGNHFFVRAPALSRATGCSTAPDRADRLRRNAFVHTPICCPSRSSYMTGKYLHNSGTFQNDIAHGCSDAKWAEGPEQRAFAAHVRTAPSSLGPPPATDERRALAAQGGGLPHLLLRQVPQPVRAAGLPRLRQERRPGLRQAHPQGLGRLARPPRQLALLQRHDLRQRRQLLPRHRAGGLPAGRLFRSRESVRGGASGE